MPATGEAVLVTGMGVLCSIARDVASFAAALRDGRSGCGADAAVGSADARIRGFALDTVLSTRDGLPEPLRRGALAAARRSPLPVRVAVAAALEAWESAGLPAAPISGDRIGLVVAGNNLNGRHVQETAARYGAAGTYLPGRFALQAQDTDHVGTLSQILGITGEGCTVGGASASGAVGIVHGSRLVELGAVDACLVVGALTDLSDAERQSYVNLGAMAGPVPDMPPARLCRPFDRDRRGFVYGQAAACVLLESQESARRRGATALGRLRGYGVGLDGNSLADPRADGEARAMAAALDRAGLAPGDVGYVNTHGTGSPLGDDTEIAALRQVFGSSFGRPLVNATKGLTGHCLSAAGVVEAVATVVQLRDGFVHPNANLERPIDPGCNFAPGQPVGADVHSALSNSFGFGGFNASLVLTAG